MPDAPTTQAEQEDVVRKALIAFLDDRYWQKPEPTADTADALLAGPLARLIAERDDARGWANRNGNAARYWEMIHGEKDKRLARAEAQRDQLAADLRKAREEAVRDFREAALVAIQDLRHDAACNFTPAYSGGLGEARCQSFYQAAEAIRKLPALTPDLKDAGGTAKGEDHA